MTQQLTLTFREIFTLFLRSTGSLHPNSLLLLHFSIINPPDSIAIALLSIYEQNTSTKRLEELIVNRLDTTTVVQRMRRADEAKAQQKRKKTVARESADV